MSVHESPVLVMVFRTRMQQGKERTPRSFLGTQMKDIVVLGLTQACRVQKRPRESSQGGAEGACSSTTREEVGNKRSAMVGSAVQRVIGLTRVPKGAPEANTQQAMAEHIGDDVHGEEGGNQRQQILCGA